MRDAPTSHTVRVLASRYVSERLARREISATTARTWRYRLALFTREVGGDRQITQVRRRNVEKALETWGRTCSASTMRSRLSVVRGLFDWAVEQRLVKANPAAMVAMPKPPRRLPRALPLERVQRLLEQVPDRRARLMCLLGLQEGLRVGEIAGLQFGDIDFGARSFTVIGKGDKERALPITAETWSALMAYLEECPASAGPLIRSKTVPTKGIGPDTVSRLIGGLMREADAGGTAHALRHTFATDVLNSGANLPTLRVALGHASLSSTQIYLGRASVPELREAMEGRRYGPCGGLGRD